MIIHLKGTGNLLSQSDFRNLLFAFWIEGVYVKVPLVNSGLSLMVFPLSSTGGLMSYTARRQDTFKYSELSLRYLPGHILGGMSVYIEEYVVFTDRRPYPNAAQSGSLTSGLSFPSFKYLSGWNSWGLSKVLRSCNIDLNNNFRNRKWVSLVVLTTNYQ